MAKPVSYVRLGKLLQSVGVQVSVSEVHGLITGLMTLMQPREEGAWRDLFLESIDCGKMTTEDWKIIRRVAEQVADELINLDFDFNLLLPKDDVELPVRIEALAEWCRGYLCGLGLVGITAEHLDNAVVKELVHDVAQIAYVNNVVGATSEEDEVDYVELVEYVRIAVQNIQVELRGSTEHSVLH